MKKAIRIGIAIICMVTLIVGYYAYLSRRNDYASAETNVELSEVQAITSKNFAKEYPATPRAVVKWYNRIISAYYAEDYTQEELESMLDENGKIKYEDEEYIKMYNVTKYGFITEIEDKHKLRTIAVYGGIDDVVGVGPYAYLKEKLHYSL